MSRQTPGRAAHEEFDELAVGWALEALEPDDETRFVRHLPDCQRCTRTIRDATDIAGRLVMSLPAEDPPEALRQRILAGARAEPREPGALPETAGFAELFAVPDEGRDVVPARRRYRDFARGLVAAAALLLIVGLGVWNVQLQSTRDGVQAVAEQQAKVLDQLDGRGTYRVAPLENHDGESVGTVVVHDGGARVMADGLAVNDTASSTYVLWGMRPNLSPIPLGTFDVTRTGLDMLPVGSTTTGLDKYEGYAISIEPGRQAPPVPTDVVATGTVGS